MTGENFLQFHTISTLRARRHAIKKAVAVDIKIDRVATELPPFNLAELFDVNNILPDFADWTSRYPEVAYKGDNLVDLRSKPIVDRKARVKAPAPRKAGPRRTPETVSTSSASAST